MKKIGVGCNTNTAAYGSQCQTYYGLWCSTNQCQCLIGRYYDSTSGKCLPIKRKFSGCTTSYQCPYYAYYGAPPYGTGNAGGQWSYPPAYGQCTSNYCQ